MQELCDFSITEKNLCQHLIWQSMVKRATNSNLHQSHDLPDLRPVLEAAFPHRSRVNRGYLVDVSVGMVICLDAHLPPENDRDTVTYALEDKHLYLNPIQNRFSDS